MLKPFCLRVDGAKYLFARTVFAFRLYVKTFSRHTFFVKKLQNTIPRREKKFPNSQHRALEVWKKRIICNYLFGRTCKWLGNSGAELEFESISIDRA